MELGVLVGVASGLLKRHHPPVWGNVRMSRHSVPGLAVIQEKDALGHIAYALLVGQPYWLEDANALGTVYPLLLKIVAGAKEPATARALRIIMASAMMVQYRPRSFTRKIVSGDMHIHPTILGPLLCDPKARQVVLHW